MDEQGAAGGDAPPPVTHVGPRRGIAVGAVDVQHVDVGVRPQRGRPPSDALTWRTRWRIPAAARLRSKATRSVSRFAGIAVELPRAAVVAGVGVDGDDGRTLGCVTGEDDGRQPAETADLDDLPSGGHAAAAEASSAACPAVSQPSTPRGTDVANRRHVRYTPSPKVTIHASPSS